MSYKFFPLPYNKRFFIYVLLLFLFLAAIITQIICWLMELLDQPNIIHQCANWALHCLHYAILILTSGKSRLHHLWSLYYVLCSSYNFHVILWLRLVDISMTYSAKCKFDTFSKRRSIVAEQAVQTWLDLLPAVLKRIS